MTAATVEPPPVTGPESDPDAPFGRKTDGTPKKAPGGRPAGKGRTTRTRRPRVATPPTRPRKPSTPRAKAGPDYTVAATGLVQLGAGLLSMVPVKACKLDAIVLHMRAEEIGAVVNKSAQTNTRVADLLDRFNQASPWAEPLMLAASIGAQLAVNHGLISAEKTSGFQTVPPEQLLVMAEGMMPAPEPTPEPAPEPPATPAEPPSDQGGQQCLAGWCSYHETVHEYAPVNGQAYEEMPPTVVV